MGSYVLVLVLLVVAGIGIAAWAVLKTAADDDEALERDERNISAGREPGHSRPW